MIFPTPLTACSSMWTACPGLIFANTMLGFVQSRTSKLRLFWEWINTPT